MTNLSFSICNLLSDIESSKTHDNQNRENYSDCTPESNAINSMVAQNLAESIKNKYLLKLISTQFSYYQTILLKNQEILKASNDNRITSAVDSTPSKFIASKLDVKNIVFLKLSYRRSSKTCWSSLYTS